MSEPETLFNNFYENSDFQFFTENIFLDFVIFPGLCTNKAIEI